jgi:hypothetical protein
MKISSPSPRDVNGRRRWTACAAVAVLSLAALPAVARADTTGTLFEPSGFHVGNIDGQGGWTKSGTFDAAIVANTGTAAAVFGSQSLRISNATTNGTFADQTFSPGLVDGAGEATSGTGGQAGGERQPHFDATFSFLSATPSAEQPGLAMTISPDSGSGGRMSFLRLRDMPTGISIDFDDAVLDAQGAVDFREVEIAHLIDRSVPHTVRFSMDFVPGANNDVVKVYIDDVLAITGTSWENYYRDASAGGSPSSVPVIDQLMLRSSSTAAPATQGKGFEFDDVSLRSSGGRSDDPAPAPTPTPTPVPLPQVQPGPAGPAGANGTNGTNGTSGTTVIATPKKSVCSGNTTRVVSAPSRRGEQFISARATLLGASLKVKGRLITVDLRKRTEGNYVLRITSRYRKASGKIRTIKTTRTLSVFCS